MILLNLLYKILYLIIVRKLGCKFDNIKIKENVSGLENDLNNVISEDLKETVIEEVLPTLKLFTKNEKGEYIYKHDHYSIIIANDGIMWRIMLFLDVPEEEYMECLASVTFDEEESTDSEAIFEEINYMIDYAMHNHNKFEAKYMKELKDFKKLFHIKYHHSLKTNVETESIDEDLAKNNNKLVEQLEAHLTKLEEKLNLIIKKIG